MSPRIHMCSPVILSKAAITGFLPADSPENLQGEPFRTEQIERFSFEVGRLSRTSHMPVVGRASDPAAHTDRAIPAQITRAGSTNPFK